MKHLCYFIILTLISNLSFSQVILTKTNGVKVNVKSNVSATLPTVEWINPLRDDTSLGEANKIILTANISSPNPITKVELIWINSAFSKPIKRKIEVSEGATTLNLKQPLNLRDGVNTIEVIVINANGGEVKGSRTISVGKNNNLLDINRKDYALLIATDNYENWSDLVNPIFDVEAIGKKLEDKYGFQVEIIKNPTQEEVILGLRKYSTRQFKEQDQLFIFFAGHGQYDETLGDGYIVTKNSRKNDLSKTSYIAYALLRNYINKIDCKHIFVSMDVCFGGTFDEKLVSHRSAYDSPENNEWLSKKLSITSRLYLTSGGKTYVPDGTPGHHSPFAKKFIEALNSNGHEDQILTMPELLVFFEKLKTVPRSGSWGANEPGSDFLFMVK